MKNYLIISKNYSYLLKFKTRIHGVEILFYLEKQRITRKIKLKK